MGIIYTSVGSLSYVGSFTLSRNLLTLGNDLFVMSVSFTDRGRKALTGPEFMGSSTIGVFGDFTGSLWL